MALKSESKLTAKTVLPVVLCLCVWATSNAQEFPSAKVQRGDFVRRVVEPGEVMARERIVVRCLVKEKEATLLFLIPEGTAVQKGDVVAVLDDTALGEVREEILIQANTAEVARLKAEREFQSKESALQQYVEGVAPNEEYSLETELLITRHDVRLATRELARLKAEGNAAQDIKDAEVELDLAERQVKLAEMRQRTFLDFTKPREVADLADAVEVARVETKVAAKEYDSIRSRLEDVEQQILNCRIVAPGSGFVMYEQGSSRGGRPNRVLEEGANVRYRETILSISDLSAVDVRLRVHESQIDQLRVGMESAVRVAADPDRVLKGTVSMISNAPSRPSFLTPDLVEYEVVIELEGENERYRPGMIAEVSVVTDKIEGVLLLSTSALREVEGQFFCLVRNGDRWETRRVILGPSDENITVIREGLMDGEEVAMTPSLEALDQEVIQIHVAGERRSPRDDPARTGTPAVVERYFSTFDRNGNEKLEMGEFPSSIRRQMKELDSDQNDVIDKEELKKWIQNSPLRNRRR